jgi:hypothetical protein
MWLRRLFEGIVPENQEPTEIRRTKKWRTRKSGASGNLEHREIWSVRKSGAPGNLEHRAGVEPANAGFADLCVSHFATGA